MFYSLQFELPFAAIINLIMLVIVFFSKKRDVTPEYKVFRIILIVSLVLCCIELSLHLLGSINTPEMLIAKYSTLLEYMNKVTGILYVTIYVFLFEYIIIIYKNTEEMFKKLTKISLIFIGISFVIYLFTHLEIIVVDGVVNVRGSTTNYTYTVGGLFTFFSLILSSYKIIKKDYRYKPILLIVIIILAFTVITYLIPRMILYSLLLSIICYILYFSLENEKERKESQMHDKNDFLSSMSHEIRTPLNAIVGLAQVLSTYKGQIPEEMNQDIDDIVSSSTTLLEIVGNILDMNKIEEEDFALELVPYNFKDKITNIVNSYKNKTKNNVEIMCSISDNIPSELIGDSNRIMQIVNNLVSNAVKFTDSGYVKISADCTNEEDTCNLKIIIEDTGKGIKKIDMDKLFTKFERLDVEINSDVSGTGLGLTITKKLVDIMNGNIEVESEEGKGTKFIVTIPQEVPKNIEVL